MCMRKYRGVGCVGCGSIWGKGVCVVVYCIGGWVSGVCGVVDKCDN